VGDDAGARAGQDSQRGVREPPVFVFIFPFRACMICPLKLVTPPKLCV